MNRRKYSDPNEVVESWKDVIYEETKALSGRDLDCYFKSSADAVLKTYRLTPRKSKLDKGTNLFVTR
ncbi:hypothetical protein KKH65_05510 [bacterium]|nr:hypothetical protein [bacterium]